MFNFLVQSIKEIILKQASIFNYYHLKYLLQNGLAARVKFC